MKKQHPAIGALCTRGNKLKINVSPGIYADDLFKMSTPVINNKGGCGRKRTVCKLSNGCFHSHLICALEMNPNMNSLWRLDLPPLCHLKNTHTHTPISIPPPRAFNSYPAP